MEEHDIGAIQPVSLKTTDPVEVKYLSQGRNFRVMTRRGWCYVIGLKTADIIAKEDMRKEKEHA